MRILVLTGSNSGVAAHAIALLVKEPEIEIGMVILSEGQIINRKKHYLKKIKKVFDIGLLSAINGIRIRKWFGEEAEKLLPSVNLEQLCRHYKINFQRTPATNCNTTRQLFQKAKADLGLSLGNSFISKSVFSICPLGMINIHGEILPEYQNAQSVIWQLYNGSAETGFTIHKINSKIDRGDILYQEKFPLIFKETLKETVAFNCAEITIKACSALILVLKNYTFYNNKAIPQGSGTQYTTPTLKQFIRIKKQFSILKRISFQNAR